jgi:hypothetical protein
MTNRQLMILMLVASAVCALIGIYYLIPGIPHVLADPPLDSHLKHALVFFGLAVLGVIASRFAAARGTSSKS